MQSITEHITIKTSIGEHTHANLQSVKARQSRLTKNFAKLRKERIDAKHSDTLQAAINLAQTIATGKKQVQTWNHKKRENRLLFAKLRKEKHLRTF